MCFFSAPDVSIPDTPTPAPLPPPIDEEKTVGEVKFGGSDNDTKKTGKDSLKITKKPKELKPSKTGVNHAVTPKKQAI